MAYITRDVEGDRQLLVFDHRDFPEAGTQVPAGTVHAGEPLEAALLREIEEETGLSGCRIVTKLASYDWEHPDTHNIHERHVYHLEAPAGVVEEWNWVETDGGRVPESEGIVFMYRWVPLSSNVELAGNQGDFLHLIPVS